jgi:membrane protease subunit HflK
VTGKNGQNNLLYLPLDKMVESRAAPPVTGSAAASNERPRGRRTLQQQQTRTRESR